MADPDSVDPDALAADVKAKASVLATSTAASTAPTIGNSNTTGTAITHVLEKDLEDLLRAVFDIKPGTNHEVLEALEHAGITSWRQFMKLQDQDIDVAYLNMHPWEAMLEEQQLALYTGEN